jgi:hypothetical protein
MVQGRKLLPGCIPGERIKCDTDQEVRRRKGDMQGHPQASSDTRGRARRDRLELREVGDRIFVLRSSGKVADGIILNLIPLPSGSVYAQILDIITQKKFIVNLAHELEK